MKGERNLKSIKGKAGENQMTKQKIRPEKMTPTVRRLWEAAEVAGLSPRALTRYVKAAYRSIYYWFDGRPPHKAQERMIREGIARIEKDFPEPTIHIIRPGIYVSDASWSEPDEDEQAAIKREQAEIHRPMKKVFSQLMAKATPTQRDIYARSWSGYIEIKAALKRHGIKEPK